MAYRSLVTQAQSALNDLESAHSRWLQETADAAESLTRTEQQLRNLSDRIAGACARAEKGLKPKHRQHLRPASIPDDELQSGSWALRDIADEADLLATEIVRDARASRWVRADLKAKLSRLATIREYSGKMAQEALEDARRWKPQRLARAQEQFDRVADSVRTSTLAPLRGQLVQFEPNWEAFVPVERVSPAVALGSYSCSMGGRDVEVPCVLELPMVEPILFEATQARASAHSAIRSLLARVLTAHPPGAARFVFVDPVAMGATVAPFLHLGDWDEKLIGGQAWVDESRIETALMDLAQHVELVIQKYLRSDYPDIAAFNREAGKIAEPFVFLCVADFPNNFSHKAVDLLRSIMENGPRCGVVPVVHVDPSQSAGSMDVALGRSGRWFREGSQGFGDSAVSDSWRVVFDELPSVLGTSGGAIGAVVEEIGEVASGREDVQVSADEVLELAQKPSRRRGVVDDSRRIDLDDSSTWWRSSARDGVDAYVGRSGASDVARLTLDDKAPHALVVGRTGMGKSNFFHVLVHSWAVTYSPDELELYLVDFKTGLAFQTYARSELPHARVVAIEAAREFGIATVQGLVDAMLQRGERFRQEGVDHISDYRDLGHTCPRTVLLIDEFHRLFERGDAASDEASRLLAQLVKEGRAYGIHVVLGSQNLGTLHTFKDHISQLTWRIAFSCDPAESRVALGEDNAAAAQLERVGEAVFNSGAGRVELNRRVQVTFLDDATRDRTLAKVRSRADEQFPSMHPRVFHGREVPLLNECDPFRRALTTGRPETEWGYHLWLGQPLSLSATTVAELRRQSGCNLLVVADEERRDKLLMSCSLAFLAQSTSGTTPGQVLVADFGANPKSGGPVSELRSAFSDRVDLVRSARFEEALLHLRNELERRLDDEDTEPSEDLLLVIRDLQRARDLSGDQYSDEKRLGENLLELLRGGPDVGIWVMITADRPANLERRLYPEAMSYMSWRVSGALSQTDSDRVLSSQAAVGLERNQLVLVNEDESTAEAFIPFEGHSDVLDAVGSHS